MRAQEATREEAARRIEKHILDVSTGRVRLGMSPDELETYINNEYRRLRELENKNT